MDSFACPDKNKRTELMNILHMHWNSAKAQLDGFFTINYNPQLTIQSMMNVKLSQKRFCPFKSFITWL